MKSASVTSYFLRAIIRNLQKIDIDVEILLRKHHIPTEILRAERGRVSASQFARIQQEVTNLLDDEMIGYFERPLPTGTFAMCLNSLIHSSTLGGAMERYCQFYQLADRGLIPHIEQNGTETSIHLTPKDINIRYDNYAYECSLYYAHRIINWLGNAHIQPLKVCFHYAMPAHAREYRPLFFGAPVFFNQQNAEIVFSASQLSATLAQNPQSLAGFLKKAVYDMLVQDYESSQWASAVKRLIVNDLEKIPELEDVAAKLALHAQTLRRRLHNEGTSFQKIKNECRRDYAIYKLSRTNESIAKISQKAGFSEPSTFIRAFKSWTGMTPSSYRKVE